MTKRMKKIDEDTKFRKSKLNRIAITVDSIIETLLLITQSVLSAYSVSEQELRMFCTHAETHKQPVETAAVQSIFWITGGHCWGWLGLLQCKMITVVLLWFSHILVSTNYLMLCNLVS
jgi:hypothetical protein